MIARRGVRRWLAMVTLVAFPFANSNHAGHRQPRTLQVAEEDNTGFGLIPTDVPTAAPMSEIKTTAPVVAAPADPSVASTPAQPIPSSEPPAAASETSPPTPRTPASEPPAEPLPVSPVPTTVSLPVRSEDPLPAMPVSEPPSASPSSIEPPATETPVSSSEGDLPTTSPNPTEIVEPSFPSEHPATSSPPVESPIPTATLDTPEPTSTPTSQPPEIDPPLTATSEPQPSTTPPSDDAGGDDTQSPTTTETPSGTPEPSSVETNPEPSSETAVPIPTTVEPPLDASTPPPTSSNTETSLPTNTEPPEFTTTQPTAPTDQPITSEPPVSEDPPIVTDPPSTTVPPPVSTEPPVVVDPPSPPASSEPPVSEDPPIVTDPPSTTVPPPVSTEPPVVVDPPSPPASSEPPVSEDPPIVTDPPSTTVPPPVSTEPPVVVDPPSPPASSEPPVSEDPPIVTDPPSTTVPPPVSTEPPVVVDPPSPPASSEPPVSEDPPIVTDPPSTTVPPPVSTEPPVVVDPPSPPASSEPPVSEDPPIVTDPPSTTVPPPVSTEPPVVVDPPSPPASSEPPMSVDPPMTTVPETSAEPQPPVTVGPSPSQPSGENGGSDELVPETSNPSVEPAPQSPSSTPGQPAFEDSNPPVLNPPTVTNPIVDDSPTLSPSPSPVASSDMSPRPPSEEIDDGEPTEDTSLSPPPAGSATTAAPPLVDVPIAIETNAPTSLNPAEALAQKDVAQNVTPSISPNYEDDWEKSAEGEKYVRGQTSIDDLNDPWKDITGNHSANNSVHTPPLIIGGKNRGAASVAGTPYAETGTRFHMAVRHLASVVSAVSVALLIVFHFVSLDPSFEWPVPRWSPNAWEFCVYVTHVQQMASVSELTLLRSPFFLWDFSDAFAWTRFLIQRGAPTVPSSQRRRLDTVLILDGLVGFADRIGYKETKLLQLTVTGFTVVMGVFLIVFSIAAVIARRQKASYHAYSAVAERRAYRLLGLCGLVWFFSLYPLSIMAAFEITMEIYSSLLSPSLLALAILTIAIACVAVLAILMRAVLRKTEEELREYKYIATLGTFYLDTRYSMRLFFVLGVMVQLTAGLSIGVLNSNKLLLSLLICVHGLYILAVVAMKPFTSRTLQTISIASSLVLIANFALSFAFLRGTLMPLKRRVAFANVFIAFNTIVLLLWFARHLVLFANTARAVLYRLEVNREHPPVESDLEIAKRRATQATTANEILLRAPRRVGWSSSLSLSGSATETWASEVPTARAQATPRTAYTTLNSA